MNGLRGRFHIAVNCNTDCKVDSVFLTLVE